MPWQTCRTTGGNSLVHQQPQRDRLLAHLMPCCSTGTLVCQPSGEASWCSIMAAATAKRSVASTARCVPALGRRLRSCTSAQVSQASCPCGSQPACEHRQCVKAVCGLHSTLRAGAGTQAALLHAITGQPSQLSLQLAGHDQRVSTDAVCGSIGASAMLLHRRRQLCWMPTLQSVAFPRSSSSCRWLQTPWP